MCKLETNIPIPPGRTEYPVETMAVGDSFLLKGKKERSVRSQVTRWNSRLSPKRFIVRKVEEGLRVWREK